MAEEIGSYDAKTKLTEILRHVESGEAFTITNRGKPVADLIPNRTKSRIKQISEYSALEKTRSGLTQKLAINVHSMTPKEKGLER